MRESLKKTKVKERFMAFQIIQKLPCSTLWLRGGGEDYLFQLSLLTSQALKYCVLFFATWNSFSRPDVPDGPHKFHLCQFFCVQTYMKDLVAVVVLHNIFGVLQGILEAIRRSFFC